jgi:hypothetical protein
MQNLRIIQEEAVGIIKVKENCQFNKVKADKVIVSENITVRLFGTVNTIVLKKGATLFLHGIILGSVENKGGEVHVFKI